MPKYNLPKLKEEKDGEGCCIETSVDNDAWYRQIRVLANKEIIEALTVGENAEVKLKGKIIALEARESDKNASRHEFEIELESVEAYTENEFSELADDE